MVLLMPNRQEIQLNSGHSIHLIRIDQWETYGGLLEGVPTKELNERIINRTIEGAKRQWHFAPYLIQPLETPIKMDRDYPFGTPASIPDIICVTKFDCFDTVQDKNMDASTLSIIWFQAEFAFPIDEKVQTQIQSIDWNQYASDYQY